MHAARQAHPRGWISFRANEMTLKDRFTARSAGRGAMASAGQSTTQSAAVCRSRHFLPYHWCPNLCAGPALPKGLSESRAVARARGNSCPRLRAATAGDKCGLRCPLPPPHGDSIEMSASWGVPDFFVALGVANGRLSAEKSPRTRMTPYFL